MELHYSLSLLNYQYFSIMLKNIQQYPESLGELKTSGGRKVGRLTDQKNFKHIFRSFFLFRAKGIASHSYKNCPVDI